MEGRGLPKPPKTGEKLRTLLMAGAAVLVCLLITAPQWIPFRELIELSTRSGGLRFEKAIELSMRPADLLGLLLPDLFYEGRALSFFPWPGAASEPRYFYGLYLGWLPLLAFMAALPLAWRRGPGTKSIRVSLLLIGAALLMALGRYNPLYSALFDALEPLRTFRYPEKFISLAAFFALPVIALGIDRWRDRPGWYRLPLASVVVFLGFLAVPGVLARLGGLLLALFVGGQPDSWASRILYLVPGIQKQALLLAAVGLLGLLARIRPHLRHFLLPAITILVGIDLWLGTWALNPPTSRTKLETPPSLTHFKSNEPSSPRVHVLPLYEPGPLRFPSGLNAEQSYQWLWQLLYPNTGLLAGLQYADGSQALRPEYSTAFFASFKGLTKEEQLRLAAVAGIEWVVTRPGDDLLELAQASDNERLSGLKGAQPPKVEFLGRDGVWGLQLWRLRSALPRAYVVHRARCFDSQTEVLSALKAGRFDPGATVGLVVPKSGDPNTDLCGAQSGSIEWASGGPVPNLEVLEGGKRKVLDEVASTSGYLVLPETWYPGWQATIDGEPSEVLMANGYQQAVEVPAGTHRIVLRFTPTHRRLALLLAFFGLAVTLATLTRYPIRR